MLGFSHPLNEIMPEFLVFNIGHLFVSVFVLGVIDSRDDIAYGTWLPLISSLG